VCKCVTVLLHHLDSETENEVLLTALAEIFSWLDRQMIEANTRTHTHTHTPH